MVAIDRSLRLRLHTLANQTVERALERAGNRVRGRAGPLRAATLGVPGRWACAAAGRALVAEAGLTDDELLAGALDDLVATYQTWADDAFDEAAAVAARFVGEFRSGYSTAMKLRFEDDLARSAAYLHDSLLGIAREQLYQPAGVLIPAGDLVPAGFVRQVVGIAGGTATIDSAGFAYVALSQNGEPVGGIATGPTMTEALEDHGASVEAYRWVYGPGFRKTPFEPHAELDGTVFRNFDDDVLANPEPWPPFAYYSPGDHDYCQCDVEPIILTAEDAADLLG